MNLNGTWIKKITDLLINCGSIKIVPGAGDNYKVDFNRDGIVSGGEITHFSVDWDKLKKTPCIRLSSADGLVSVCHINRDGTITGRNRNSGGYMVVSPLGYYKPDFKSLYNSKRLAEVYVADTEEKEFRYKEPLADQIDWSEYKWDLSKKIDRNLLTKSNTAIAIAACDRPLYFKKVVQSLAHNVESNQYPVFGFFDEPEEKNDEVTQHQIDLLMDKFPDAVAIRRPRNFGCGRNLIDIRRQLFDNMEYERVYVLEDDMILSKYYIKYVDSLFDWAQHEYTNIGAVQGWSWCNLSKEDRSANLDVVKGTYSNWWGYCMLRGAWNSIKTSMYRYEDLFLGSQYKYRPHESIKHWFTLKMGDIYDSMGNRSFSLNQALKEEKNNYFADPPTGQDAATMHLFESAGWARLSPVVNRGKYIGKNGIHMNDNLWNMFGYESMLFQDHDSDLGIKTFNAKKELQLVEKEESPIEGFSYRKD